MIEECNTSEVFDSRLDDNLDLSNSLGKIIDKPVNEDKKESLQQASDNVTTSLNINAPEIQQAKTDEVATAQDVSDNLKGKLPAFHNESPPLTTNIIKPSSVHL